MKLIWLEDFLALAQLGSFSKAAEARHVTQPAFSRRIRALEHWLGVSLVDRTQYPTMFTAAGQAFIEKADALKAHIYAVREQSSAIAQEQTTLLLLAQHSLAISFLPAWLDDLAVLPDDCLIKVAAADLHDAIDAFLAGNGDLLLSFYAPQVYQALSRADIETLDVGTSRLVPVSATNAQGQAIFDYPTKTNTSAHTSLRLLAYPADSFLGQIVTRECLPALPHHWQVQRVCENALAEGLKAMALKAYGVAWLPECLIGDELQQGRLQVLGAPLLTLDLPVRLYRFKHPANPLVDELWQALAQCDSSRLAND